MGRQDLKYRASVKVVVADGDSLICQGLRNALTDEGYQDIRTVGRLLAVREIMATSMVDLLVLDVDLPDGDGVALVRDIRHGKIGRNPFLPIIFVTWEADTEIIRRAVSSGVDLILLKPASASQLFSRIDQLIVDRKPFVVTADYVGPDRRDNPRREENTQFYQVPNTLKDKMEGRKVSAAALSGQIASTVKEMNSRRLEEAAIQLNANIDSVCRAFEARDRFDDIEYALSQASYAAKEIANLGSIEIVKLCASLMGIIDAVRVDLKQVPAKQIELLWPMAQSILMACKAEASSNPVMEEISKTLSSFNAGKTSAAANQDSGI